MVAVMGVSGGKTALLHNLSGIDVPIIYQLYGSDSKRMKKEQTLLRKRCLFL